MENFVQKKSNKIIKDFKKLVYNSTFCYDLVIKNGKGCIISDIDDNRYIDFTSNIAASPLGYGHPEIMKILKKYSNNGVNKIAGQDFYCEEHIEIAKRILSISPKGFKVFLVNSGAEAVENSLKLAYKKKGALPGICFENSFHGRTLGALSVTSSKEVQKNNFPELPVKRLKFCTSRMDLEIEKIEKIVKNNKIAFIIAEIIQGEGGVFIASDKFIKEISKVASNYDVPLILDEVQTGLGRTGKWWVHQHYDVTPNMITMAKGLQVGAVAFEGRYDPMERGVLSSTWGGGDRIDMAIGAKIIEVIQKENLLENSSKMGSKIIKQLLEFVDQEIIQDVRGKGLMIGIECTKQVYRDNIIMNLFKKGLLVLPAGIKTIRILPPLIVNKEIISESLDIFYKVIKALNK